MAILYLVFLKAFFFDFNPLPSAGTTLTVQVELAEKLKSPKVYLAIFTRQEDFPDHAERIEHKFSKIASNGKVEVELQINDVKSCAIACYADLNNNGKLDLNWLGIPKEPYTFSGVNKWYSKPNWERSRILLNSSAVNCTLHLK